MRRSLLMLSLASLVGAGFWPLAAGAEEARPQDPELRCTIKPDKHDVVQKSGDVVIEPGRKVKDVLALDGSVTIRKGARVQNAVAAKGSVIVEDGAVVEESAVALKGEVKLAKGAQVKGSRVWIDKSLHVVSEEGAEVDVDVSFGNTNLGEWLLAKILQDIHGCVIRR